MSYTKIICTLGPACETKETIADLIASGMNIARLNFSHGNHQEKQKKISILRSLSSPENPIGILLDNKGPEIRTGKLQQSKPVTVKEGAIITLHTHPIIGDDSTLFIDYANLAQDISIGKSILIDDGKVELRVLSIDGDGTKMQCVVVNGGEIGENKGVNLPDTNVTLPSLTKRDKEDIRFGCEQKIDRYALSFVRSSADIVAARKELNKHGGESIKIIAKIENQQGVDNYDEILKYADGIMVARGDLGVEVPIALIPLYQKHMIDLANQANKPVITATEMLNSMITNPRPTRAEVTDIANAILDGTDAVMLSGETASGKYPKKSVTTMRAICKEIDSTDIRNYSITDDAPGIKDSIAAGAVMTAASAEATCIIIATRSGDLAHKIRKHTPACSVLTLTDVASVFYQLTLVRGVYPFLLKQNEYDSIDAFHVAAKRLVQHHGFAQSGDHIITVYGDDAGEHSILDSISIVQC